MSDPFMLLVWTFLPMVIVALLTKKFAERFLRKAKPIIIGIVSSIVAIMMFVATIGGFFVGMYLYDPTKLSVERTETVENLEQSVEELEDQVVE